MTVRTILAVLLSYGVAAIVAAVAVLVLLDLVELARNGWTGWLSIVHWDGEMVWIGVFVTVVAAFIPFMIAIAILHVIRQTGWLAHLLAGLAVSFVAQLMFFRDLRHPPIDIAGVWPILVGGALAGLVYWAVRRWLAARWTVQR